MSFKRFAIALAVLGTFATGAKAQSGVIMYGVLDSPIEYVTHVARGAPTVNPVTGAVTQQPGGSRLALQGSGGMAGPRWGFRGTEELGATLQAVFVLEGGYGVDDGKSQQSGRLFGRQAYVGLRDSRYGAVTFGRQYTPMFDVLANFGPLTYASLYEPAAFQLGPAFRQDNVVKYVGVFGGVSVEAHWSFGAGVGTIAETSLAGGGVGETPGHFRDNSAYGASLTYFGGPFGVTAVYDQWNPAVTVGNPGAAKKAAAAASYTMGPVKLMAGYRWGAVKDGVGTMLLRDDYYWAGVNYQATPALGLNLGYYYDNLKEFRASSAGQAVNLPNPWQVSFLTDYTLSKRTNVYLTFAYSKNSGLNFDTSANGFANGYFLAQGSSNQFGAAVGIRHKF